MKKEVIERYWSGGIDRTTSSFDIMLDGDDLTLAIYHDPKAVESLSERGIALMKLSSEELDSLIGLLQATRQRMKLWRRFQAMENK